MQYEDSKGCLWTEEEDAEGYVYYVNANTLVSSLESMHAPNSNLEIQTFGVERKAACEDVHQRTTSACKATVPK